MDWEEAVRTSNDLFTKAIPLLLADPTGGRGVPTYKPVDTSELDYDRERVRSQREVVSATIQEELQNYNNAGGDQKKAIQAEGAAKADAVYADKAQADRAAEIFAQYGQIFGVTPDSMAAVVHDMNSQRPKLQAAGSEIAAMQAVGPGDNILEWWGNQFALPGKINEYNARAATYNMMQETLDSYIKSANAAATFTLKGTSTISAAQAKAKADFAKAEADKQSAIVDETMAKTNVTFATQQLAADVAAAEKTLQSTELQVRQRQNELQAMIHGIQFSENQAMRMLRAAELAEKLAKGEDEMGQRKSIEVVLKNYDRIMGHPVGTTNFNIWRVSNEAQRNNMIAIGVGSVGPTPVSAMMNWYRSNPGPLASPDTSRIMEHIRGKTEGWLVTAAAQTIDEKQKIDFVNKKVTEEIGNEIKNASKFGSPFYEMSPARMLESAQMNPESVVAKVLAPLAQRKDSNIPTELVAMTIAQAFKNPNDAGAAISDYYKRNMALRNTSMNTALIGITLPTTYQVKVRLGAFTSAMLDLTNPADATKYAQILQTPQYGFTPEQTEPQLSAALPKFGPTGEDTGNGSMRTGSMRTTK
jgi:hypothetical protein